MSIIKVEDTYELVCDICGEYADDSFDEFDEAVEYKKDRRNGWRAKIELGDWVDYCPDCNRG